MKVLFVSQCAKHALVETRRIIDQFAERKGDAVWETNISEQGLTTVKNLLKATARRNTAVACHLLRGHLQTELLWIVGNTKKFNRKGNVPTNVTEKDILKANDENEWNHGEAIAILSAIAGLFHDFGKANELFQMKLKGDAELSFEPFRHEWISLCLFKQFVGASLDQEWIERLSQVTLKDEDSILKNFPNELEQIKKNPLKGLPRLAKFIGWLILSHHRLPVSENDEIRFDTMTDWTEGKRFSALWNSPKCKNDWGLGELKYIRTFPYGTPFTSKSWCVAAKRVADRALKYYNLLDQDWFQDRFSMHLMRAILMMSDHFYSSGEVHPEHQDSNYQAFANTEKGSLKQKLDEHNIGVARNAFLIAKSLPKLKDTLPSIIGHKDFKKRNKEERFTWQDQAYDLAVSLKDTSHEQGFFGINLASTGCGKTLANARIMYGLSDEKQGCRFSIALGLRVLTLQTGETLKEKLSLSDDDLAVMIGCQAFQELYEMNNKTDLQDNSLAGSESQEDLIDENDEPHYSGTLVDGYFSRWLRLSPKLLKLISAPITVSTIDHIISATESCRGGKQIAPILRLLTSDLVLDEPDDFDVEDLPALSRLVNFAGVFGSRVLLSSATLPPAIVKSLFESYAAGRKQYNKACRNNENISGICCAWFDEFGVAAKTHGDSESFMQSHQKFIEMRVDQLEQKTVLRRASLAPVQIKISDEENVKDAIALTIQQSMYLLHDKHHQVHPHTNQKVSFGLVRMANITPLVSVAKLLLTKQVADDFCIHYCIYHSQFPLIIRSKIEEVLDNTLSRHDPERIWKRPDVMASIADKSEKNHIFIVIATSVAEVGRDHDYDWAIAEPSSMRSIIQLAGRVQRHRCHVPSESNLIILSNNLKGLTGSEVAYTKPGFESKKYNLINKNLSVSLLPEQYEKISAIPRLHSPEKLNFHKNLSDLEHMRLEAELLGSNNNAFHASLWWKHNVDWCGEMQRVSQFRKSQGSFKEYFYYQDDEFEMPRLCEWPKGSDMIFVEESITKKDHFTPCKGYHPWIESDIKMEIERIAERQNLSMQDTSIKYARIRLRELEGTQRWLTHPILGFYKN